VRKEREADISHDQWNRIWVIQEVILPSTVTAVLGRFTAPLRMFTDAASNLERHKSSCCAHIVLSDGRRTPPVEAPAIGKFCRKMLEIEESGSLWRRKEGIGLLTVLRLFYSRQATDARDKVYGLLSLVTEWGNRAAIEPNYTMTTPQVYQEAALRSIEVSRSLAILAFRTSQYLPNTRADLGRIKSGVTFYQKLPPTARLSEEALQAELQKRRVPPPEPVQMQFPSWTPDWESINRRGQENLTSYRINRAFIYDACPSRPAPPHPLRHTSSPVLTRTSVLTVSAIRIGAVRDGNFMPILNTEQASVSADNLPLPWNPDSLLAKPYVAGGNEYEALCRTVCADSFFASSRSTAGLDGHAMFRRAVPDDLAAVQAWRRWLAKQGSAPGPYRPPALKDCPSPEEHEQVVAADRAIRSAALHGHFFRTDTGYMGLAYGSLGDDEAFLLLGSRMPYMLRPLGEIALEGLGEQRCYAVVGEAYVHGVMDGELARDPAAEVQELFLI
jgi:hypothetical protein